MLRAPMASHLTAEEVALFTEHIRKIMLPGSGPCPMCQTNDWDIAGPMACVDPYGPPGVGGPSTYPFVALICRKCFYARHFMWMPIKKAAGGG